MVRALGLVSVLATLAVVGYLFTRSAGEATSPVGGSAAQDLAADAAAEATLLTARTGVDAFFAANGTFAGAPVPTGVSLVAADAVSYCLQLGAGAATRHLTSPGSGLTEPGPC
jgi:hypothetical protein